MAMLPNHCSSCNSLALISGQIENEKVIMITGADTRGLVYGILELADRLNYSKTPPRAQGYRPSGFTTGT